MGPTGGVAVGTVGVVGDGRCGIFRMHSDEKSKVGYVKQNHTANRRAAAHYSNDGIGTRTAPAAAGTKTSQAEQGKVSGSISSSRGLDCGRKRGGCSCSISHQSFSHDL